MMKEVMFSAVQFLVPAARVLDLYAGTGQLGIEALSRGAKSCVFVDNSSQACKLIHKNLERTGLDSLSRVINNDVFVFLNANRHNYDLIFIDPPYRQQCVQRILPLLNRLLSSGGMVLCETESQADLEESYGALELKKKYTHGTVAVWLYRKAKGQDEI